jgi:uncharacterized lipoprotein YehR (DUF1307 family)
MKIFKEESRMLRKIVAVVVMSVFVVSFAGCKKKEEKQQLPAGHPSMEGGMPSMGQNNMAKVDRKVVVSKEVQAKWKAVKIAVEDKKAKATKEYTVNVGSDLTIPNTKLNVKVLNFLPDFKMTDKEINSSSAQPNMPAAQVVVSENGKEIWSNWLFSLQPGIHPFQHDSIGLVLLGGVTK